MLKRVIKVFFRQLFRHYKYREIKREQIFEEKLVLEKTPPDVLSSLNEAEINEVKALWSPLMGGNLLSFKEMELFKHFHGFDPRFVSHYIYLPILSHRINNYKYTMMFEHKSLLGVLSKGKLKFPACLIRCIDNELYDNQMHYLSFEDAVKICVSQNVIVLKDSVASSGGKSFEKIEMTAKRQEERCEIIKSAIKRRIDHDFVIQECIKQHSSIAKFNKTSINTFRVTTLYLNGKFSVLSIVLRIGKKGMNIDNWGGGGIIIGVKPNGQMHEKGYDNKFNTYKSYNEIIFKDTVLSQVPSLLKLLEEEHSSNFSLCKLIGWDIAFNENNDPIIIELNSSQPGLIGEQIATGPIFGDRTEEVINYCANKKDFYNRNVFPY